MPLPVVGKRIWSSTTFSILLSLKPSAFGCSNASSRFGPTSPLDPASFMRVAAAAFPLGQEELLARARVSALRDPAGAAAGHEKDEPGQQCA